MWADRHERSRERLGAGKLGAVRAHLTRLLKLGVSAGLVYWLLASGRLELGDLGRVSERWHWLAAAQVSFAGLLLAAAVRWRLLLRAQGIDYRARDIGALTLVGWFFNQMIVGTTGGDVVKAYAVAAEHPEQRSAGVMSIVADRAMGLVVLLVVILAAVSLNWDLVRSRADLSSFAVIIAICLSAAVIGLSLFYSQRVRSNVAVLWVFDRLPFRDLLRTLSEAVYIYRFHPREVLLAAGISAILHSMTIITNLFLAAALLGDSFDWMAFLVLVPMAHAAMAVPINPPGAIGTAEAIYAHLFSLVGISQGGVLCILQRLTFYAWAIPGALLYVLRKNTRTALPPD